MFDAHLGIFPKRKSEAIKHFLEFENPVFFFFSLHLLTRSDSNEHSSQNPFSPSYHCVEFDELNQ